MVDKTCKNKHESMKYEWTNKKDTPCLQLNECTCAFLINEVDSTPAEHPPLQVTKEDIEALRALNSSQTKNCSSVRNILTDTLSETGRL